LQADTFVFPSRTQKAADENRRSQKPPAAWICARTFGKRSINASHLPPSSSHPERGYTETRLRSLGKCNLAGTRTLTCAASDPEHCHVLRSPSPDPLRYAGK
jgi:hypothetical protein